MKPSDFNTESLESIESMDELRRKIEKLQLRGALILSAFVSYLIIVVLLPREIAEVVFGPGLAISIMISFVGLYLLTVSSTLSYYAYGITILRRISPPDPAVTEAYAVTKHGKAFIFVLRSAPYALYFVSFFNSELTPAMEIDIPRTFWKWNSTLHIEGLRVHNRSGRFSIPTPEREIYSGEGILLALPIRGTSYILHVPEFSRDRLLAVTEYVSLLTSHGTLID